MEAIPRATSRNSTNRERSLVTRHALRSSHAATPPLPRMRQYTPFATISATGLNMSRGQLPIHAPPGEQSHSTSPRPAPSRFRRHHSRAKLQIPIDHRRSPAGSCMGGFRTPAPCPDARPVMAGIRKPSPSRRSPCSSCARRWRMVCHRAGADGPGLWQRQQTASWDQRTWADLCGRHHARDDGLAARRSTVATCVPLRPRPARQAVAP